MQNLRYAVRVLAKQPLFTAIVIVTFALGIGANTAVFSVVNAVLLRPLPFHDPQNLVAIGEFDPREKADPGTEIQSMSYLDYVDWRDQAKVFERIGVYTNQAVSTLTDGSQATHVQGESVSANLFALLGVQPMLGRTFLPNEDEPGNHVVVLSHELWQRRFGGDHAIVGKDVTLDGRAFQVIGVMPPRFTYPLRFTSPPELWISMSVLRETPKDGSQPMTEQRDNEFFQCIARLKPNVSIQQAQANVDTIVANWQQQYPESKLHVGAKVIPEINAMVGGSTHSALLMLCAMAGCVLLVACVNVANLLLARSLSRNREISIRAALGAGRWHIIRQLVIESVLLGVFGGLAGLLIAVWGIESFRAFLPNISRMGEISLDPRVLAFTASISLLVGICAGLLPAWRASHPNLAGSLNESSRGSTESTAGRTRTALVVVEIVLALVLLASAGLLVESFLRLQKVPAGFDTSNVMTARVALPDASYPKPQDSAEFYKKLLDRVSILPGVESAAAAWWIPLSGSEIGFNFNIEERPVPAGQQPVAEVNVVTSDYFQTMRAAIRRGRVFTDHDDRNAPPVAIVTESFAKQYFPGEDPIGKRITANGSVDPGKPPVREIVGVIADMHLISLRVAPKPQIYIPHQQFAIGSMSLFVRTQVDPESLTNALRRTVAELDKDVPIYRTRTLTDYMAQSVAQPRLNAMLVTLFAVIALLLAAAGIFGVMSYSVAQRTQEIGIRMALGAQRYDVLRLIVVQGMRFVGIGLAIGLIGVLVCSRLLQSFLFGIGATDLGTMIGVTLILTGVAFLACVVPARRATLVDPIKALRME
ncbi:MAG TPA: ABC transporter permease [Chthoniobacterales bacterium]|nr:ABC transporter permease [Chthoniobacterales bacterium]